MENLHIGDHARRISTSTILDAQVVLDSLNVSGTSSTQITTETVTAAAAITTKQLAGACLGIALPLILALLAAGAFILKQRRALQQANKDRVEKAQSSPSESGINGNIIRPLHEANGRQIVEGDPSAERKEVDAWRSHEMDAGSIQPFDRGPATPEPFSFQTTPEMMLASLHSSYGEDQSR